MNSTLIYTILSLSAMGAISAIVLYFVSKKFHVHEDPRIAKINDVLPGVNCGACGYTGCRAFAEAMINSENRDSLLCPVGGEECMKSISSILGINTVPVVRMLPIVKCNGACENRPKTSHFDGASSCAVLLSLYEGETECRYGCLGQGDCAESCKFGAITMDPVTRLPVIDDSKCVSCGVCVAACSKNLISMRPAGPRDRKIYVSCKNEDRGGLARKHCSVACIGCGKCVKVCPFDAITIENNLAYIDPVKCKLCRKCVAVCPTKAIVEVNFPPPKPKPAITVNNVKTT